MNEVHLFEKITTTLAGKTFFILGSQLAICWVVLFSVFFVLRRAMHLQEARAIQKSSTETNIVESYLRTLSTAAIKVGIPVQFLMILVLMFWSSSSFTWGMITFAIYSLITGLQLGTIIALSPNRIGLTAVGATVIVTICLGVIGMTKTVDLTPIENNLIGALYIFAVVTVSGLFYKMNSHANRAIALIGIVLFSSLLVLHFNSVADASRTDANNNWETAFHFAIQIFLDIINLLLQIIEALSQSQ